MAEEFIRTAGTNGVVLQMYKENYSLAAAFEGKDGKVMLRWAKNQKGRDAYDETATPVKVQLGPKETAVATCLMILKDITGMDYTEIPF
jgi:hypothetical protein